MSHQDEKQVIFFKDLLFAALYQWKKAVIIGLVLAVTMGVFGFVIGMTPNDEEPISLTPEKEQKIALLKANEERLEINIQQLETYLDQSVLMQLNPYECASAGFYLYISTASESAEETLLHSYRASLDLADNMERLAEEFEMDANQFQELIIYHSEDTPIFYENCVYIAVRADTLENAILYRDAIEGVVLSQKDSISKNIAAHKVSTYKVSSGPAVDAQLVDLQNSVRQQLSSRKTELTNTQNEISRYTPSLLSTSDPNPLLYAAVGGFAGIFLVIGFAWMQHIGTDKVYSARVLTQRTGVNVLGCVRSNRKRSKADLRLRKWEGRADHTSVDAVAANIRNRCDNGKNLLLMGSFQSENLDALLEQLNNAGICCKVCPDPTVRADAFDALPATDAVVLIETCNLSRYDHVEWAMKTVAEYKKPLLGCVLIDG